MSRSYRVLLLVPAILAILNFGLAAMVAAGPCMPGPVGC
jgi:hypothetical protein